MKIIAGLGNPGSQYETTRHNIGFLAVDRLIDHFRATGPQVKYQGEIYSASVKTVTGIEKVLFVKPQTFMNLSGKCIGALFHFHHCQPGDLIVLHDELDLPPMSVRIKTGGGTGGHNGIKSIDECVGKDNTKYHRIRMGIGHPARSETRSRMSPADYVLERFDDIELKELDKVLDDVTDIVQKILNGQITTAMNQYHRSK